MTLLFQPGARLTIGTPGGTGEDLSGLRVSFRAQKSSLRDADPGEITVYNLADDAVGLIRRRGTVADLRVQYGDDPASSVLYGRMVKNSLRDRQDGTERKTSWQVHDGGTYLQRVPLAYAWDRAVDQEELLAYGLEATGCARGVITWGQPVVFPDGHVLLCSFDDLLRELGEDTLTTLVVQDGRLQGWPRGKGARLRADVIDEGSGLESIGHAEEGVLVRCMMRPWMRPGDIIQIGDAGRRNGQYRVLELSHLGDTHGDPWHTEFKGKAT